MTSTSYIWLAKCLHDKNLAQVASAIAMIYVVAILSVLERVSAGLYQLITPENERLSITRTSGG